jgi:hypothetical protein
MAMADLRKSTQQENEKKKINDRWITSNYLGSSIIFIYSIISK